jgi:predicted PurR-regulated permease PerM
MNETKREAGKPAEDGNRRTQSVRVITIIAGVVIVVAGLRAAQPVLIPFLVAVFLAVLGSVPLLWLQRKGVPAPLAVLIVVAALVVLGVGVATLLGTSLNSFTAALPGYQERLREEMSESIAWLTARGIEVSGQAVMQHVDPGAAMGLVARVLAGLGGVLTNAFLITLTVVFILLEASSFPGKVRAALGKPEASLAPFTAFAGNMNRYLAIKTAASFATGVSAAIWVWILGIDFPLLWGLVAFLLNYIPNLGSIIAAVPPVLLGFIQYGLGRAALVAAGYVAINVILGSMVEPRFQGRGLGISTLVVFLSLVFWGWVWGPVGMLLSVPLTMTLKIALEISPETRWVAVLMGPASVQANPSPAKATSPEPSKS